MTVKVRYEGAVEIGFEDRRMDVALAADGPGVAQPLGDRVDRLVHVPLRLGLRVEPGEFQKGLGGKCRSSPSAEVLRRELLSSNLAEVIIHVGGGHVADLSVVVDESE